MVVLCIRYYLSSRKDVGDLLNMWGTPKAEEDVAQVFVKFLQGKIRSIPWITADDVAPETNRMRHDLERINGHGFLSINSQPAVNGAPSTDPDVGWGTQIVNPLHCKNCSLNLLTKPYCCCEKIGPPDSPGYVFQKAYIEFFTSPFLFQKLLKVRVSASRLQGSAPMPSWLRCIPNNVVVDSRHFHNSRRFLTTPSTLAATSTTIIT